MTARVDPARKPKARQAAMAVTVILGACVLALGAIEASTRLFLPAFDPSGRFEFDYRVGSLWLGQPGAHVRQAKNTGDFDVRVAINRHGLRDSNDVAQAGREDLVVIGDSVAWGWGVEEDQRFSNLVQKQAGIRTFNVSAPTDLEGYLALLRYAESLGAEVGRVLLAVSMETDLGLYAEQPEQDDAPQAASAGLKGWLERHSAAYLFAVAVVHQTHWLNALAVRGGLVIPNLKGLAVNEDAPAVVEASADMILKIASRQRTLVMLIPSRGLWTGPNRALEQRVHAALVAALGRRGVDVLDLRPAFEAGGRLELHFANDGHWNARGHELAAHAIVERLAVLGYGAVQLRR
jgi:hypothetical protein